MLWSVVFKFFVILNFEIWWYDIVFDVCNMFLFVVIILILIGEILCEIFRIFWFGENCIFLDDILFVELCSVELFLRWNIFIGFWFGVIDLLLLCVIISKFNVRN